MEPNNGDVSTRRRVRLETDHENINVSIEQDVSLRRELNLIGGIALIVATSVGSGIFISPNGVLQITNSIGLSLVTWLCSGIIAILGGLCYCELGTLVTRSGGEFAYIMEAFGSIPAFLFAWTSAFIVRPSAVAITCLTFAEYMARFFPYCGFAKAPVTIIAILTIIIIMILNSYSVAMTVKFNIFFSATTCSALGVIIIGGIVHIALDMIIIIFSMYNMYKPRAPHTDANARLLLSQHCLSPKGEMIHNNAMQTCGPCLMGKEKD